MGADLVTATTSLGTDITTVLANVVTALGNVLTAFGTVGIISALIALGVSFAIYRKVKGSAGL